MHKLEEYINQLEALIPHRERMNPAVSAVPVGWHLAHSLLVLRRISHALAQSDPATYKPAFNFKRMMTHLLGRIPRGRGQAPDAVKPRENFTEESLRQMVMEARQALPLLNGLTPNHHMVHPVFGDLNLKRAIRTFEIHTRHHLLIIKDIVNKSG